MNFDAEYDRVDRLSPSSSLEINRYSLTEFERAFDLYICIYYIVVNEFLDKFAQLRARLVDVRETLKYAL